MRHGAELADEICTVSGVVLYSRNHLALGEPSVKPVRNVGIGASGTVPATTGAGGAHLIAGPHATETVTPLNEWGDPNGAVSSTDTAGAAMAAGWDTQTTNQIIASHARFVQGRGRLL